MSEVASSSRTSKKKRPARHLLQLDHLHNEPTCFPSLLLSHKACEMIRHGCQVTTRPTCPWGYSLQCLGQHYDWSTEQLEVTITLQALLNSFSTSMLIFLHNAEARDEYAMPMFWSRC